LFYFLSEGKSGTRFRLSITVMNITNCQPMNNAVVDLWHCDAQGLYSHFLAASLNQNNPRTDNSTFFRGKIFSIDHHTFMFVINLGQQVTNQQGIATFDTIYPGWYRGRATHVHIKVHVGASLTNIGGAIYTRGGHVSHTGQLYFDDTITDQIATLSPYSSHSIRRIRNDEDGIFRQTRGSTTIIPTQYLTNDGIRGPMRGEITVGIDPTALVSSRPRPPMGQ
jgi:protocatechuate 3,4-dioxygenase beta subunit